MLLDDSVDCMSIDDNSIDMSIEMTTATVDKASTEEEKQEKVDVKSTSIPKTKRSEIFQDSVRRMFQNV